MLNQEIANILFEIGYFLEMEEAAFRPQAYEKAAITLENLEENVLDIYKKGGKEALIKIPGIGKSIAEKIEEYIKTGKIKYYEKWKKKVPVDIDSLMAIEGIGPKTIKTFYQKLGITNIEDLEKAAKNHKVAKLFGFGKKAETNILQNIKLLKGSKKRQSFEKVFPVARDIRAKLNKADSIKKATLAGSIRRKKETVGDIDILAIAKDPKKAINRFLKMSEMSKIWGKGETKVSARLKQGIDIDLRVIPQKSYGAALLYFTGPKEHNITLRKIAIAQGYKLNEYGLFKGNKLVVGKTERGIYKKLGLKFISPEKRSGKIN
jgi:DNA polymerase (family X)